MDNNLQQLQQWLQSAITTPWVDTKKERHPRDVIVEDRGLSATSRLAIYSRAYQGRLVECMAAEYPVLQLAMGKDLFVRFASEYLIACPSRRYTLTALGKSFPEYLRQTRPTKNTTLSWAEFLIEVATLERLVSEVYHAEGTEETDRSIANETSSILTEPGVRWMRSQFAVDDYFIDSRRHLSAPDRYPQPDFPKPISAAVLIFRRDYVVRLRRIAEADIPPADLASENESVAEAYAVFG